jgi:hypothetical protein
VSKDDITILDTDSQGTTKFLLAKKKVIAEDIQVHASLQPNFYD